MPLPSLSYDANWWPALRGVMAATLNGCTAANIFRAQQINRFDWREAINGGQLPLPYFAVHVMKPTPLDGAMDNVTYSVPVTVFGVYSASDPNASIAGNNQAPYDITSYLISQAAEFRDGLLYYDGGAFQVTDMVPFIDVSDENTPNQRILVNNASMLAWELATALMIGQNYSFAPEATGAVL